jgi:hypothetical protein
MNVEIGAEAAQFPEKEYIIGISVAVWKYETVILERPGGAQTGQSTDDLSSYEFPQAQRRKKNSVKMVFILYRVLYYTRH